MLLKSYLILNYNSINKKIFLGYRRAHFEKKIHPAADRKQGFFEAGLR